VQCATGSRGGVIIVVRDVFVKRFLERAGLTPADSIRAIVETLRHVPYARHTQGSSSCRAGSFNTSSPGACTHPEL